MENLKLIGSIKISDFPVRITEVITTILDLNSLNSRLERGGTLTLENATLYIGNVNSNQDTYFSIGVSKLKLINSKIFTNGNTFEIFCNDMETDALSKIAAFETINTKDGENGVEHNINATDGQDGDNGGIIRINLTDKITGNLSVNLHGQNGGNGGNGYNGKDGINGSTGRSAWNGDFGTCRRGPGRGGDGKNGQNGGNAGNGGNGGDGGTLFLNYIEKEPQSDFSIILDAKAGVGGKAGTFGKEGKGGKAGMGGSNAGNCTSRNRTRNSGRAGIDGIRGLEAESEDNGIDGKSVIQRVNIGNYEFIAEKK